MNRGGAIGHLRVSVDFDVTKPFCAFICQHLNGRIAELSATLLRVSLSFPRGFGNVMPPGSILPRVDPSHRCHGR
jgi:hypothetical protein